MICMHWIIKSTLQKEIFGRHIMNTNSTCLQGHKGRCIVIGRMSPVILPTEARLLGETYIFLDFWIFRFLDFGYVFPLTYVCCPSESSVAERRMEVAMSAALCPLFQHR